MIARLTSLQPFKCTVQFKSANAEQICISVISNVHVFIYCGLALPASSGEDYNDCKAAASRTEQNSELKQPEI